VTRSRVKALEKKVTGDRCTACYLPPQRVEMVEVRSSTPREPGTPFVERIGAGTCARCGRVLPVTRVEVVLSARQAQEVS